MDDQVRAQAGWAIWSKHPGTRDDYSVIAASSGPLSIADFTRVLTHFAPGNPPADCGTPASLPWVTLSRVGVTDRAYLGVSIQVPTDSVDGTGRPISRTSYICIPYEDLAGIPVSYGGLADALTAASLPCPDGALLPLTVPRLDSGEQARAILEFGPDAVATTAALLLAGPVTITGTDLPGTPARLRFLDAVAALLPYGYRTTYTAATWSDTAASGQRLRIVFGIRARDGASRVAWRAAAPVPASGPARHYLAYLQRVTADPAAGQDELERLIGYLSRQTRPGKFEQPEQAVASLSEFFRPAVVSDAMRAGTASIGDIRLLFATGQNQRISVSDQRRALEYLIRAGIRQDWPLIKGWFATTAGASPQALLPAIEQTCQRLMWSAESKDLVTLYLQLAAASGQADELLAALIAPPGGADLAAGLDTAAMLLATFAVRDPGAFPRTQRALAGNPVAGAALLARLSATAGGVAVLSDAIGWLEPALDRLLPKFNAVLGDVADAGGAAPEQVDARAVDELSSDGSPRAVGYLLQTASQFRRLHLVLPGFGCWLAWQVLAGAAVDRRYWTDLAMELAPGTAPEAAWLDLALLAAGSNPTALFTGKFPAPQLNHAIAAAWADLTELLQSAFGQGAAADDLLSGSLIEALARHSWRSDQAQAAAVHDLAARLTPGGVRPRLTAAVLDPVEALRQLTPQVPPALIAEACARAYTSGLTAQQTGQALAESSVITSGALAADVLQRLRQALYPGSDETSDAWQEALADALASGGVLSQQVAADFAVNLAGRATSEMYHSLRLLGIVAATGTDGMAPGLTATDASNLEQASDYLHGLVRDTRKRLGGRGWRSGRAGGKDGGE